MKKIVNFGIAAAGAAAIVFAGSGVAAAATETPSTGSSSTGSANLVTGLAKLLSTGSAGGPACTTNPTLPGCPK